MGKLLVDWWVRALSGPARLSGPIVRYSKFARGCTASLLALLVATTLAVVRESSLHDARHGHALAFANLVLTATGAALVVEFFRVRHDYDGAGINYRSPWSPTRRMEWARVARIEWRPIFKWLDIVPADGSRRLHLHPMIGGLAPLAKLALQQMPSYVWADQPEAYIALRLMASGHHVKLALDARKPSQLAADPDLQLSA